MDNAKALKGADEDAMYLEVPTVARCHPDAFRKAHLSVKSCAHTLEPFKLQCLQKPIATHIANIM